MTITVAQLERILVERNTAQMAAMLEALIERERKPKPGPKPAGKGHELCVEHRPLPEGITFMRGPLCFARKPGDRRPVSEREITQRVTFVRDLQRSADRYRKLHPRLPGDGKPDGVTAAEKYRTAVIDRKAKLEAVAAFGRWRNRNRIPPWASHEAPNGGRKCERWEAAERYRASLTDRPNDLRIGQCKACVRWHVALEKFRQARTAKLTELGLRDTGLNDVTPADELDMLSRGNVRPEPVKPVTRRGKPFEVRQLVSKLSSTRRRTRKAVIRVRMSA